MFAISAVVVLKEVMVQLSRRRQAGQDRLLPASTFDLICGSSASGSLGILLSRLGLDCDTALRQYASELQSLPPPRNESRVAAFREAQLRLLSTAAFRDSDKRLDSYKASSRVLDFKWWWCRLTGRRRERSPPCRSQLPTTRVRRSTGCCANLIPISDAGHDNVADSRYRATPQVH